MSAESDQVCRALDSVSVRIGKLEEEASRAPDIDLHGYGALNQALILEAAPIRRDRKQAKA